MNRKIDYFFSALDLHLALGKNLQDAIVATVEDYETVFSIKPPFICAACGKKLTEDEVFVKDAPVVCNSECGKKFLEQQGVI